MTISPNEVGFVANVKSFDLSDEAAVQAEIERRALELCNGKSVRWGKFGSVAKIERKTEQAPQVSSYYKEFNCVAPDNRVFAVAPFDWQPSPSDDADARAFFELYFSKRDSGDFAAASAMFDSAQGISLDGGELRDSNARLGAGNRRISKITWYVNPEGAAHSGVFAALDFVGDYKSMHLYCGYLVLYRIGPGSYEIVREEQNRFERNEHAPDPAKLAAMRASTCRE